METKRFIKVDLNDEEHCIRLLELLDDYMKDEIGLGQSMPPELGPEIIKGLKEHSAYIGFFACIDDHYTGLANCNINYSTWQAKPLLNIHDFTVSSSFRNRGIGLFLMDEIEQYARQNGFCRINLEVRHDNIIAQKLYLKAGFNECQPPNLFWEKRLV